MSKRAIVLIVLFFTSVAIIFYSGYTFGMRHFKSEVILNKVSVEAKIPEKSTLYYFQIGKWQNDEKKTISAEIFYPKERIQGSELICKLLVINKDNTTEVKRFLANEIEIIKTKEEQVAVIDKGNITLYVNDVSTISKVWEGDK